MALNFRLSVKLSEKNAQTLHFPAAQTLSIGNIPNAIGASVVAGSKPSPVHVCAKLSDWHDVVFKLLIADVHSLVTARELK